MNIRIDSSTSIKPIWQAGTYGGADLNETNQASARDVIMSRSRDKLKTCLHYQGVLP